MAGRRCALLATLTLALLSDGPVRGTSEAPFGFVEADPVTFTWAKAQAEGLAVQVLNNTTTDLPVQIHLSDLGFRTTSGPLSNSNAVSVTTGATAQLAEEGSTLAATLPRGTVTTILIRARTAAPPLSPGMYPSRGYAVLSVSGGSPGVAIHRRIRIGHAIPIPPQPLVQELRATGFRLARPFPVWRCSGCTIPLAAPSNAPAADTLLGVLHGKRRGFARVVAGENQDDGGTARLRLLIETAGPAGEYSGVVQLGEPDDKKTAVALTVDVKDEVLVPLVVLMFGTWAALKIKRYLGVLRSMWALREREAKLALTFGASQAAFADAAGHQPYAGYSIAAPFIAEQKTLVNDLGDLERASGLGIDTGGAAYKAVLKSFDRLENIAKDWGVFASSLAKVDSMLARLRVAAEGLPATTGDVRPRVVEAVAPLLTKPSPGALVDHERHVAAVMKALAFGDTWLTLASEVARDWEWATSLRATHPNDPKLDRALGLLAAAAHELRDATDAEDLAAHKTDLDIDAVEAILASIEPRPPLRTTVKNISLVEGFRHLNLDDLLNIDVSTARTQTRRVPEDHAERLAFYRAQQKRWDRRIGLVAFAIAMLAGLNSYYFDKPFGSLSDYVGLLLVALGTRAAADAVGATLEWFGARHAPNAQAPGPRV